MNMNDIVATFACVAMEELDKSLKKRKIIGEIYRKELNNLHRVKLLNYKIDRKLIIKFFQYMFRIELDLQNLCGITMFK